MGRSQHPSRVPAYVIDHSEEILSIALRGVDTDLLPDAALSRAARIALVRRLAVPRGKVTASVRHGWVTLQGDVGELCEKEAAQRAVEGLQGVNGVTNNICVESDALALQVQRKLAEVFADSRRLRADHILVTIHDHTAILTGAADSETERREAAAAARSVTGIVAVVNQIRVDDGPAVRMERPLRLSA